MKCIAYVSKAPVAKCGVRLPIGLSNIVKAANRNKRANITGFLSYHQGHYLEVMEGPNEEINQLVSKILADTRHEDSSVFINKNISTRSFSNWRVSVFDLVDQTPLFKQFVESYHTEIAALTEQQKTRIQHFYDLNNLFDSNGNPDTASPSTANPNTANQSYEGKNLRLLAWPDFNRISNSQMIINLCVKLTKQPYPFDVLIESSELGTREQIITALREFEGLGILHITESALSKQQETAIQTKKPSSFYSAIKKFLGMG